MAPDCPSSIEDVDEALVVVTTTCGTSGLAKSGSSRSANAATSVESTNAGFSSSASRVAACKEAATVGLSDNGRVVASLGRDRSSAIDNATEVFDLGMFSRGSANSWEPWSCGIASPTAGSVSVGSP